MKGMVQLEIMMIQLPFAAFSGDIVPELRRLPREGDVRLVDLLLVSKDADGHISVTEPQRPPAAGLRRQGEIASLLAGLRSDQADEWNIAGALPEGHAAAIAVIEHCWAAPLLDAVERAGGQHLVDDVVVVELADSATRNSWEAR